MPKWPVSFVDGSIQVADADGTHYPVYMDGVPVTSFSPGWNAMGLQTGLAPFHLLELRHETGLQACWMLDSALEYRANGITSLGEPDQCAFLNHVEPLIRNLFEEAVLAPHAANPAAAHEFDGLADHTVAELIRLPAANVVGTPNVVAATTLGTLGGGYARDGVSLPASWIEAVLRAPVAPGAAHATVPAPSSAPSSSLGSASLRSQETLTLPGHAGHRFHDRASGLVFYLLVGAGPSDRHLYVPQANVVFTAGDVATAAAHDPLGMLLLYYATHTDRAVMLPEMDGLHPVEVPMTALAGEPEPPVAAPIPSAADLMGEPAMGGDAMTGTVGRPWPEMSDRTRSRDAPPVPGASRPAPMAPRGTWWQRLLGRGPG